MKENPTYECDAFPTTHVDKWDLDPNLTHYIIINCLNYTKQKVEHPEILGVEKDLYVSVDEAPTDNFLNNLIQALQITRPCISVQALHISKLRPLVDGLARDIPILFLDSRNRETAD